jgi:hypothetical protein
MFEVTFQPQCQDPFTPRSHGSSSHSKPAAGHLGPSNLPIDPQCQYRINQQALRTPYAAHRPAFAPWKCTGMVPCRSTSGVFARSFIESTHYRYACPAHPDSGLCPGTRRNCKSGSFPPLFVLTLTALFAYKHGTNHRVQATPPTGGKQGCPVTTFIGFRNAIHNDRDSRGVVAL